MVGDSVDGFNRIFMCYKSSKEDGMVLRMVCVLLMAACALPLSGCIAKSNSMKGLIGGAAIANVIQQSPGSRGSNTLIGAALGFGLGWLADKKKSQEQSSLIESGQPFRYVGNYGEVLMYVPQGRFVNKAGEECRRYDARRDFQDGPLAGRAVFCKENNQWKMREKNPVNQVQTIRH